MSQPLDKLVLDARKGDCRSLECLLLQHSEQLRLHLLRGLPKKVQGHIAAEDVLQETLTQAYSKIKMLRGDTERSFVAWLFAIGDMTLIDVLRKETAQRRGGQFQRQEAMKADLNDSLAELMERLPGENTTASRNFARKEGVAALQVAMAGLPDDQRMAIQLHMLQGKSLDETAAEMDRTKASVRSLMHRAKTQLAEAMGRASDWLTRH